MEPGDGYLRITDLVVRRPGGTFTTSAEGLVASGLGVAFGGQEDQLEFKAVPLEHIQLARDILDAQVIDMTAPR